LLPAEHAFVHVHFGTSLSALEPRLRLYLRRLGDTRRAWSLNGGRMAIPRASFEGGDPRRPLRLADPGVAGVFAHELLHQWQRLRGQPVTRQAAWLQCQALCLRRDPYAYARCDDADAMWARFARAQVEQQAQMWEDHVRALQAGQADPAFARIAAHVRDDVTRYG
jgi:hypothetical protein